MEHVPPIAGVAVAIQLPVARHTPDIGGDPEGLEQFGGLDYLRQNRAAAKQLRFELRGGVLRLAEAIQPLEDAFLRPFGHRRHGVLLVHHRQVIEDALLLLAHPANAVLNDDRELVRKGRIVAHAVRNGIGQQLAVTVLVLQPFA